MAPIPYWAKVLPVAIFGCIAYALMQSAEFARQDYELAVCTNSDNQCQFSSASSSSLILEASFAVVFMGLAFFLANGVAPPKMVHMKRAFTLYHFVMVLVWYFFALSLTIVPLVYTCYLIYQQNNYLGANLYSSDPAVDNTSELLTNLAPCDADGNCTAYNPCNQNNIYCLSIQPGMLAGFGYLFAGAAAFWAAWIVMDDTAYKVLKGEDADEDHGVEGAYFSAVPVAETKEPPADTPHMSQVR